MTDTMYHIPSTWGITMNLSIPPEPIMLKNQSKEKNNARNWDMDSLLLWFGNRLPSYLWNDGGWSQPLKDEGYTWQSFLKLLSLHKKEMIHWARDAISWNEFLLKLQDTLKDPVFKAILIP